MNLDKEISIKKPTFPISLSFPTILSTYTIVGFASFVVPFLLGQPQLVVGSIVNTALFLSALFLPQPLINAIILLPSLALISRGLVFGPLTPFLFIMLPFIWAGNWLLVNIFKQSILKKTSYWLAAILASVIKFIFLYTSANLLFKLHLIPQLFLTTMGIFQLTTALIGSGIAFLILKKYHD